MKMVTPHTLASNTLNRSLGLPESTAIYLKREDEHPYGSHKGRSIPVMIDRAIANGFHSFIITSSGNAALAAGLYVKELNKKREKDAKDEFPIKLEILVGLKISPHKRAKLYALADENIKIGMYERPLQTMFNKTEASSKAGEKLKTLRQSNDDEALIGYEELGKELLTITDLRAIFISTSSGTTAQALAEYFLKNSQKNHRKPIEVHIVQTSSCHPIADAFNEETLVIDSTENSVADAIVDHTAIRKTKLVPIIEKTDGAGWIATNESIKTAQELLKNSEGISISTNSALSVVGLMNAIYAGREWKGSVACLITGE